MYIWIKCVPCHWQTTKLNAAICQNFHWNKHETTNQQKFLYQLTYSILANAGQRSVDDIGSLADKEHNDDTDQHDGDL